MKKYILAFFTITSSIGFTQTNFEQDLETAFNKSRTEKKPLFIEYYSSNCGVCKKVAPLFNTKEVGDFYNKHFVNYKIDTQELKTPDSLFIVNSKLNITTVPKLLFFDAQANLLHYSGANDSKERLLEIAETALDKKKRTSAIPEEFKKGRRELKFLYDYSDLAILFNDYKLADELADLMYEVFPKDELGNDKSYLILKNAVFTTKNGFFEYWINNLDKLKGFESEDGKREIKAIERILSRELTQLNKNKTSEELLLLKDYVVKSNLSNNPDLLVWERLLQAYTNESKYKEIQNHFNEVLKKHTADDDAVLYLLYTYVRNVKDFGSLNLGLEVVQQLLAKHENLEYIGRLMIIEIDLLGKLGKTTEKEKAKAKALTFFEMNDFDKSMIPN